jgi:O-antigen/teichoic acid export membrane protein
MSPTSAALGSAKNAEPNFTLRGEMRTVSRHWLIYMLGPALSNAVGFVMIPVYTRFINSSQFGIMSLVDVVMTLTMLVLALGVADGMTRFYYAETDPLERRRLISTAIVGPALLSLPLIVLAILGADWLRRPVGLDAGYANYLRVALWTAWFSMLAEVGYSYLRMCYMSTTFVAVTTVQIAATVVLNVLFVVVFAWGIWGVLLATMLVQAAVGIAMAVIILARSRACPSVWHLRRLLGFGMHLVPATVMLQLTNYLNPIMLRWLLPGDPLSALAQVGLFSLGQKLGVVVNRFLTVPFNAFWRPRRMELVMQNSAETRHILARMCTYSTLVTCQLALLLSASAEDLLQLLVDPSYAEAYRVVPWIAAAYVVLGLEHHFVTGMHYSRRTQWATPIGLVSLAALVASNLMLVPHFGMQAAAAATLISVTIRSGLFLIVSQRMLFIPYETGRLLILACVAVLLYLMARQIQLGSLPLNLLMRVVVASSLVPLLCLVRFFSFGELAGVRGLLLHRSEA